MKNISGALTCIGILYPPYQYIMGRYCSFVVTMPCLLIIISPNEMFGDIMLLASRSPRPPIDTDDVNTQVEKYSTDLFQILYEGRYPPEVRCY